MKQWKYIAYCVLKQPLWTCNTCYQIEVSFDYQNQNMCETKNDDMTKEPTNKNDLHKNEKYLHGLFN